MIWVLLLSSAYFHVTSGDFRLPGDVVPKHYDVKLVYDVDPKTNYSFYGVVDIIMKAIRPTSRIILHAQDFTILARKITLVGVSDFVTVNKVSHTDGYDFLTLELQDNLVENENYTLSMPFYGNVEPRLDGVFIRSYNEKDYKKQYLLATHFDPISARRAFPCFDEPLYKATFRLTIGHHRDYTAVSNMPVDKTLEEIHLKPYWPADVLESTFNKGKWNFVYDKFKKSPEMSPYLVAFVISKFQYKDPPPGVSSFHFRTWARSETIQQIATSETGLKILYHFERWYNTSYPLPKLDLFAIPDFPVASMENWGLIMYDEPNVLFDKYHSTTVNKEKIAKLLSHELTHQWFGNLVTMKWWSDLWLKEGLGKFFESIGTAALDPQWNADSAAVENIMPVLELDSLDTSHPLSVSIDDPKRLNEIFDEFAYCKGAALLRMLFLLLGEKVFKRALHNYLEKYAFSNAEQDDLWQQFNDAIEREGVLPSNASVKNIMDTWTRQAGYPVLSVDRDYSSYTVNVTQKRYVALDSQSPGASSWWVPISMLCAPDCPAPPVQWLQDDPAIQRYRHGAGPDDWLMINYNMIAPYRVNYDLQNWQTLIYTLKSVKYTTIPVLGRAQLLSDALELAWTNRLDYSIALDLASYLQRERNYLPLKMAYGMLNNIDNMLKRDPDYFEFQRYMRRLVADAFWSIGGIAAKKILSRDDIGKVKLQVLVSEWACNTKMSGCEENAIDLFNSWMKTTNPDENNPIPDDLRGTVYCVAISRGSVQHWRFLHARALNATGARGAILQALACTREIWLLHQYLERTIADGCTFSSGEAAAVIAGVVRNTVGHGVAKEFIYTRIADIYNVASIKGSTMGLILQALLKQFTTQQDLDEFLVWSERHAEYLSECVLSVERALEGARGNIAWLARNAKTFIDKVNRTITEIFRQRQVVTVLRKSAPAPTTLSPAERLRRIDEVMNRGRVLLSNSFFYCLCVSFLNLLKYF